MTKDDIRLALRISCAELNIKLHNTTLAGLSRRLVKNLEKYCDIKFPPVEDK